MPYIEERLARIEAFLGLPPYDPNSPPDGGGNTTGPPAPTFFRLVENTNRTVTASWSGASPTYEVHEFLADPANTLKATVTTTTRTSGALTLGQTYEYAVRAVDAQGRYSPFSQRLRVTIGSGVVDPGGGGGGTAGQTLGVGGISTPSGAIVETGNRGSKLTITSGGTAAAPKVYDGGGFTVTGGILVEADNVIVQNYYVNAQQQYGIYVNNRNNVIIQNCDIKGVTVSGDGDLNAITFFGNDIKILYNTAIDFVSGNPGSSHTDAIQTWVSSSHPIGSSNIVIKGNKFIGPANPSRTASIPSIHQCIMAEGFGRGGNSGGNGTDPSNWTISDNEFGDSWNQCIKLDGVDNVTITRNAFVGSSTKVMDVTTASSNVKFYSDNAVGSGYGSVGMTVTSGAGPGGTDTGGGSTVSGAPGEKFDLTRWYITLPIAATDGSDTSGPWDIYNPRLKTFVHSRYFYLDSNGHLKLEAPVKGVTTSAASGATRDEFREETADGNHAAWSATTKTTSLTVTMKCDPSNIDGRKEAIVGQIHNPNGTPPVYLAVNHNSANGTLSFFKNGPSAGVLISNLSVNDWFTYRLSVSGGRCKIWAAKGEVANLPTNPQFDFPVSDFNSTSGCYFKCGVYNKQDIATATTGSTFGTMSRIDLV